MDAKEREWRRRSIFALTRATREAPGNGRCAEAAEQENERIVPKSVSVEVPDQFVSIVTRMRDGERRQSEKKRGEETGGFHED